MEYKKREVFELEPHYSKHVNALTKENLLGKSSIPAELAYRDWKLAESQSLINDLQKLLASTDPECAAREALILIKQYKVEQGV